MPRRSDKYQEKYTTSRVDRNKNLYQDIKNYEYVDYTDIEPVVKTVSLSEINEEKKGDIKAGIKTDTLIIKKIEEEISTPDKEYDINKVIDLAKKNRSSDLLEEKRKLKKDDYNITSSIDINKIDELKQNKKVQELSRDDEDEIKELIDTIYSNTLKLEIEKNNESNESNDLFSDLIAENDEESLITNSDTTINDEINKAIIEYEKEKKESSNDSTFDNSFFTKSLEIKKSDLLGDNEEMDDSFINDRNSNSLIKIILFIIIAAIILVLGYFYFIK